MCPNQIMVSCYQHTRILFECTHRLFPIWPSCGSSSLWMTIFCFSKYSPHLRYSWQYFQHNDPASLFYLPIPYLLWEQLLVEASKISCLFCYSQGFSSTVLGFRSSPLANCPTSYRARKPTFASSCQLTNLIYDFWVPQ